MRAVVIDRFGGPEVLTLRDLPVPEPGPGQVRVAVHAAGTNPVDAFNCNDGTWARIRPPAVLGYDAAGVVDALGPGVTDLAVGDEVFYMAGLFEQAMGTYAEYHVVDAGIVARKPRGLSHAQAAAIPLAGSTAYQVVARRLAVQPGEWVLIHGAAGGVGSFAVQIAAARGARVIGVASAHHHDFLRTLGAVACVDYHTQDVVVAARDAADGPIDVIADFVGGDALLRGLPAVRPFGRAATIVGVSGDLSPACDANLTLHCVLVLPDREGLEALSDLVERGLLRPVVDMVLPLDEAARAHRRLDSGHGRGKVVLAVR
jgi:NADPH2:quinone reductase